ncbi:type II toxin-antitoxin system RelE/ParE family toxin [Ramlibacter sp. WS9]|uniref:type II toxin-antitoxin system RelE/ParE family toxin n=1 Tax=Ramlibacter sp. WS9 TaxID=1882741 RepID=UPI0011427113|nr:type II toxin-antitoxin system RelE/ParE family toxin [Ramlibacter sp. WS9]
MNLVVEAQAQAELNDARDYYLEHASANIARAFLEQFERAVNLLRMHPALGTPVSARLRKLPLRRFPYWLIYRLHGETLSILAVAHQRRRPGYWSRWR